MTPSCTSGVASFGPLGSDQLHATRRSPTVLRLTLLSGLKPDASYVRRHESQSPAGGVVSIASVTGRIRSNGLGIAGGDGIVTPGAMPPPPGRGQSGAPIVFSDSASTSSSRVPGRDPFSWKMYARTSA